MKSRGLLATRVAAVGLAVLVVGGALLGATVMAGASGTSTGCTSCSLTVMPSATGLSSASAVQVTGSGFAPKATGAVVECNLAPGEPTVPVPDDPPSFTGLGSLPVGCSSPNQAPAKVSKTGTIFAGRGVILGTVGPPAVGTDSGGGSAAADAANFPCPPTQDQVNAGVSCAFVYQDSKGQMASTPISFTTAFSVVTTTTTTTTAPPAPACTPTAKSTTTSGATVTVDPATCLVGNEQVMVSGTGLQPNALGSLLECNNDPSQPTEFSSLANEAIPVSCSNLTQYISTTTASGTLSSTKFTILVGTVGPPATGTPDSTGGDATTDAAKYPCPPTAAELAESPPVSCVIAFGDQVAGKVADEVLVPLQFGSGPALPAPAGTKSAGATAAATTAKATTTPAGSGALAFTGTGPGLTLLAVVALVLVVLGASILFLVEGPRMFGAAVMGRRRCVRRPVSKAPR